LALGAGAGLWYLSEGARATADLATAHERLSAGDLSAATRLFDRWRESRWATEEADAGQRLVEVLRGSSATEIEPAELRALARSPFRLNVMARKAFEEGRFETCVELAELARRLDRAPLTALEAASLFELGRVDEAAEIWSAAPAHLSASLGRQLDRLLENADLRPGISIRDRQGRPIAHVGPDGELELEEGLHPRLLPPALARAALEAGAGPAVRTSLDLELSEIALEALGGYRGSIVLLDVRSGDVLAAISDRRTLAREGGTPAFEQLREPASIAKIITTTATQRAGLDPDAEIGRMRCRGHRSYAGQMLYCPYIAGPLRGLDRALAVSCNVAFADLGVKVGRSRVVEEFRRYGFDRPARGVFDFGRVVEPRGDNRQLADLSIGLEASDITPLHAALLAATVGGDGVMPEPRLVVATDGRLGFHPRPLRPEPRRRVLEPEWLPQVRGAMEAVAGPRGTGRWLAPKNFPVAMKTGTASHPLHAFHVNYIGYGPLPEARLAFAVRITHRPTSKRVRRAARIVTERLLHGLGEVAEERGWDRRETSDPGGVRFAERPAFPRGSVSRGADSRVSRR